MKTNLILLLFVVFLFTLCKKDETPAPTMKLNVTEIVVQNGKTFQLTVTPDQSCV